MGSHAVWPPVPRFSLNVMCSGSTHIVVSVSASLLLRLSAAPVCGRATSRSFSPLLMDTWIVAPCAYGDSRCRGRRHTSFCVTVFPFLLGVYLGATWVTQIFYFNILRNSSTFFQSDCTIFHSCWPCTRVPVSLHPCPHLLFSAFFINCHPSGCKVVSPGFDLHFHND